RAGSLRIDRPVAGLRAHPVAAARSSNGNETYRSKTGQPRIGTHHFRCGTRSDVFLLETGALPAAGGMHSPIAQRTWNSCTHGDWLSSLAFLFSRMGRSKRTRRVRLPGLSEALAAAARRLDGGMKMRTNTQELKLIDSRGDDTIGAEVLHWDGRLDNREELIRRLRDSLPVDASDATIARACYERWGTGGLVHLIGDWSVVIRDHVNRTTVLASDFAGVRPLYYHVQSG